MALIIANGCTTIKRFRKNIMITKPIIKVKNLTKKYGSLTAVDNISFEVAKGRIVAFLGPNGAGKTTTLEMLEGLTGRSDGQIEIYNFDPARHAHEVKKRIGVQLQSSAYYDFLNLKELIDLFASFYKKKVDALKLLAKVGLVEKRQAYVSQLSGGQKQRFAIIAALVNNPEIVFLDEPTTGLDPQARRNLWTVIKDIKKLGKTVILTTHYMEEAQVLADHILVMDHGKIVAQGTPTQLISQLPNPYRIVVKTERCLGDAALKKMPGVVSVRHDTDEANGHYCLIGVTSVQKVLPALLDKMKDAKIDFTDLEIVPSNLEDVFLSLTGEALRD
jgi:ABC-2 type transport system ATP-binding protein